MSEHLNSVEWREFKVSDLFEVFTGGDLILSNIEKGIYPIISHSITNNGIASWTQKIQGRKLFNYKNTISLADRGNFFATIQNHNFYIGTRVKALESKNKIAHLALLFIALCINKQNIRFSYGKNCCGNTESMRIMLPIDSQGQPNYDFMEKFMRQIEKNQIKNQLKTIKSKLTQSTQYTFDINTIKWKDFKLSQIFKNYHGKRLKEKDRIFGNTPLLTAGKFNNGITSFIENKQMKIYKDFISIDMFGNSFYHSYSATGDDNIYFFVNDTLSHKIKLFIVACVNMQKPKYSYGKQFRQSNADNITIMLPIDSNGNPHYDFMESTMRKLEQKHLKRVFVYFSSKVSGKS